MGSLQVLNGSRHRLALAAFCAAVSFFLAGCPDTAPPSAPTNLSATASSQTQIDLTWTAATDNVGVTGYQVERCQGASCNTFARIATPTAASFSDTGLTAGTSYSYRARAVDAAGNPGPYSNIASATTLLPPTPAAPTGVSATPGNGQVVLSWPAVPGATSYNVYSSPTALATTSGTLSTVSAPGATLSPLTNGTPIFAAVTAVNAGGESALSNQVCGVPTAADTTNVTLYDPLCGSTLDGQKWQTPLYSRGVAGGAMELRAQASNMESRTVQFLSYQTLVNVNSASRVSALRADITVPATTASRSGTAELRAIVRLSYQPPANRLNFPGGSLDQLVFEIGLTDTGSGLRVVRNLRHCDSANCLTRSATGITFTDPVEFTATGRPGEADAAAAYDTPYTIGVTLNETNGIFSWVLTGGAFTSTVSGTADPSDYLGANTNWSALGANPLSTGGGFLSGQLGVRVLDESDAGGSAGGVTGRFQNVRAGFNNGAPTSFDDFSGTPPNSGPTELSAAKWTAGGFAVGNSSMALTAGKLAAHAQVTSPTNTGATNLQSMTFNDPAAINTLQADVTISACSNSFAAIPASNRVQIQGNFYNDNSPGATPPNDNRPNGNVGDVRAILILDCVPNVAVARFAILRLDNQAGTAVTGMSNPSTSTIPLSGAAVGTTHTLRLSWDPNAHTFTFVVDGTQVVVDPTVPGPNITTAAAFAKTANSPNRFLVWVATVPNSAAPPAAGATASIDFNVNNIFTAP
jgi:hypothetical protein